MSLKLLKVHSAKNQDIQSPRTPTNSPKLTLHRPFYNSQQQFHRTSTLTQLKQTTIRGSSNYSPKRTLSALNALALLKITCTPSLQEFEENCPTPLSIYEEVSLNKSEDHTGNKGSLQVGSILTTDSQSYSVMDYINSGGMAEVYKVTDKDGKTYAAKIIKPHLTVDVYRDRFKREIEFMKKFDHSNIISYISSGTCTGRPFFIMEYADGRTLEDAIEEKSLTPKEIIKKIALICFALDHIYTRGVAHRDVKPSNVLLFSDGNAKLSDFGVAATTNDLEDEVNKLLDTAIKLTGIHDTVGTPIYMAPEQALKVLCSDETQEVTLTSAVDRYSIGVMLYEAITGNLPIEKREDESLILYLRRIATEQPPHLSKIKPEIPEQLANLIMRLLEKEPEYRLMNKSFRKLGEMILLLA